MILTTVIMVVLVFRFVLQCQCICLGCIILRQYNLSKNVIIQNTNNKCRTGRETLVSLHDTFRIFNVLLCNVLSIVQPNILQYFPISVAFYEAADDNISRECTFCLKCQTYQLMIDVYKNLPVFRRSCFILLDEAIAFLAFV